MQLAFDLGLKRMMRCGRQGLAGVVDSALWAAGAPLQARQVQADDGIGGVDVEQAVEELPRRPEITTEIKGDGLLQAFLAALYDMRETGVDTKPEHVDERKQAKRSPDADADAQGPRSQWIDRCEPGDEREVPASGRADEEEQSSPWPTDDEMTQARDRGEAEGHPVRLRSVVACHVSDPPRPAIPAARG